MQPIDPSVAHLSGPIAGSSLTRAPGSVPWEKPPQYTSVDEVMHFFLEQFQDPKMVHHFLATMEAGAPLDITIYTILSHGFSEGKWTPSLMILLIKPLTALCMMLLHRANVKYIPSYSPKKGENDDLFAMVAKKKEKDKVTAAEAKKFICAAKTAVAPTATLPEQAAAVPQGGFMSPPSPGDVS